MIDITQMEKISGADVRGPDDDKIGSAGRVYVDDATGEPSWVTVSTGFFGTKESFVPLADATWDGDVLRVPYDKGYVKDAPSSDPDGHLTVEEEQELYRYYGVDAGAGWDSPQAEVVQPVTEDMQLEAEDQDVAVPTTDDAMTRSEEHLEVSTEQQEVGPARLRKYVVTEQETVTVPVSHEEIRVEHEPITDANRDAAMAGEPISEDEHEVVLHAERPVVTTEAEPVERVRLTTETVTEQETVTGDVRKEHIEVDGDQAADLDAGADRRV